MLKLSSVKQPTVNLVEAGGGMSTCTQPLRLYQVPKNFHLRQSPVQNLEECLCCSITSIPERQASRACKEA